ncbi:hypothetical protein LIER_11990 [Lithospermum erythrorhizon]|uniref:TmcB/TmcC TPR repeats domain-containing protein n=1 Tax=Lithospermum erythrorhizon TaxID=34254 RepID=A0AAV3PRA9_LITER
MLSRSNSSPLLRSLFINDPSHATPPTLHSCLHMDAIKKTSRTYSELNLKDLVGKPKTNLFTNESQNQLVFKKQENKKLPVLDLSISTTSLETEYSVFIDGGSGGGRLCGGGGGGGDRCDEYPDYEQHGFDQSTDQYYQELVKANPTNALVLGNYAKFLKEVKGDHEKAEEYLGRAILTNANDGQVFSMYGGLMWDVHKDTDRAKYYFNRAVEAAPDDCYVHASYARFLWDAEEEENDDEEEDYQQELFQGNLMNISVPSADFPIAPWDTTNSCFMT